MALPSVLILLIVISGCSPALEIPPTPTPTATAIPISLFEIQSGTTFEDLIGELPESTISCLRTNFGSEQYRKFLNQKVGSISNRLSGPALDCIDPNISVRLFISILDHEAGGISTATVTCIKKTLGNLDLRGLFQENSQVLKSGLGPLIGVLLCVNDDEAESINVNDIFGPTKVIGPLSLADIRCMAAQADISIVSRAMQDVAKGSEPEPAFLESIINCR